MFCPRFTSNARGFSLIELMIVLVLLAIMAGLAVPSMRGMVDRGNATRALETIASDIAHTRTMAVRDGRSLEICFTSGTDASYRIRTGPCNDEEAETLRTVRLAQQYRGLSLDAPPSLGFNARGLRTSAEAVTISVARGGRTHSLNVSGIGRVHRDY
jgi:prepilin-type N-terminal cleavage/methylation domain-containing protein